MITTLITMPIWYFLLYTLLQSAHVDRLVWFLFWIYIPFSLTANIMSNVMTNAKSQKA